MPEKHEICADVVTCDINKSKKGTNPQQNTKMLYKKNNDTHTVQEPNKNLKNSQDIYRTLLAILIPVFFIGLIIGFDMGFIHCLRHYGILSIYTWLVYLGLMVSVYISFGGVQTGYGIPAMLAFTVSGFFCCLI